MNAKPHTGLELFFAGKVALRHFVTHGVSRWAGIVTGLALAAGLMTRTASSESNETQVDVEAPALTVNVIEVHRVSEFHQRRRYTGTIVARRTSEVGFERSARLVELFVDEGDHVTAGQPLAKLDTRHLETQQAELQAQRVGAEALLEELVAGPRHQTIAAVRAELDDLNAQVELQTRTRDRTDKLLQRNAVAEQQLDDVQFGLDSVTARRDASEHRLSELLDGTRKERIAAQRATVERLDALLDDLAIDVKDSILVAPYSGRIAERFADEGKVVASSEPILRIVETAALEARIGLPPSTASRLVPGQAVDIVVRDRTWPSTVDDFLPEVDLSTRTQVVVFQLDAGAAAAVVPGEIARIEVAETEPTDGFWVPTASLTPGARGLWSVMAVVDGCTERRDVEVLHTVADQTLVRGTLIDGDCIIAGGTQRIVPGQQVTVSSQPL